MSNDQETPTRVKCPPSHAHSMALSSGMLRAADLLDELPNSAKSLPGVALARSAILAEAHELRTAVLAKSLAIIARAGHDVGRHKSLGFDPNESELLVTFYDEEPRPIPGVPPPADIEKTVTRMISDTLDLDNEMVSADSRIIAGLGADSLDVVELVTISEEKFDVEFEADELTPEMTIRDVVDLIEKKRCPGAGAQRN